MEMELFLHSASVNIITMSILFLICFFFLRRHTNKRNNLPAGKLGLPLIGETIEFGRLIFAGSVERFIANRMSNHSSKIFKTRLLGEKMVVLCGPAGNKFVYSNDNKLLKMWVNWPQKKIFFPSVKGSTIQDDLLRWRKLFSEFLRPHSLQKYVGVMDSMVKQHMDSAGWEPDYHRVRPVHPLNKKLAFTMVCRLFTGIDDPTLMERLRDLFVTATDGMFTVPIDFPGTPLRRAINAAKSMHTEFENIILKKRSSSSVINSDDHPLLLSLFISATDSQGKFMSETEIAQMVVLGLLAGHETTSALFTNIVYYLADNPHVYARALTEQLEIKKLKGEEKLLTWEDTRKMKYSRQVVNEILRLAPPAIGGFRVPLHEMSYEGYTIPKGWKVFWSTNSTHKDPKYFQDPENFDPTRFEGDSQVPYTFTPFGGGPRMCPGNEFAYAMALLFMHNLLINFKWENVAANGKPIRPPLSFPKGEALPIRLQRRDDGAATQDSITNVVR